MHGQFIGARRVRCGWAQHKTDNVVSMDPQVRRVDVWWGVVFFLPAAGTGWMTSGSGLGAAGKGRRL